MKKCLVGDFNPLKNMSMGRIIPYSLENKECLKPPTRCCVLFMSWLIFPLGLFNNLVWTHYLLQFQWNLGTQGLMDRGDYIAPINADASGLLNLYFFWLTIEKFGTVESFLQYPFAIWGVFVWGLPKHIWFHPKIWDLKNQNLWRFLHWENFSCLHWNWGKSVTPFSEKPKSCGGAPLFSRFLEKKNTILLTPRKDVGSICHSWVWLSSQVL